MKGLIHSVESMATLEGDGIRYGVFMAGCPLRCWCCHNPDTWESVGESVDETALAKKILRYKPYFKNGGGVTFTGGEPMLQAEFINKTAQLLESAYINYAIDTSGHVNLNDSVKLTVEKAELVILDLKFWDSESYAKYTSGDFEKVKSFAEHLESIKKRTWIRTVIIPNINDSLEILDKYIKIVKKFSCVEKFELLAFHTMGFFKYDNLGLENKLKNTTALSIERLETLQKYVDERLQK